MFKVLKLYIFIGLFCIISIDNSQAALYKPNHSILNFCQKYAMMAGIFNAYPNVLPSVTPIPNPPFMFLSIVPGLVSKTSVVQYVCDTLTKLENLDDKDAIFFLAEEANTLSGEKWTSHLDFAKNTFTMANTLFDFENGKSRQGALKSIQTHSQINEYMKQSYGWYNKTFNNNDATLKTRGERESDMNEMAQAAYQTSMLKEILTCPDASGGEDYTKVYEKEIKDQEKIRDNTKDDIQFYTEKLLMMGPKISNNESAMTSFLSDFNALSVTGVTLSTSSKTKEEITYKSHPTKKDKDGKALRIEKKLSSKRNVYKAIMFEDVFRKFNEKYTKKWSSWVTGEYMRRGSLGLFDDPRGRVESDFKDLSYECQTSKIMAGVDPTRADYETVYASKSKLCYEGIKMDQKKAINLFSYYIGKLQVALYSNKEAVAKIWTAEAWYLGYNRSIGLTGTASMPQEQVTCEKANTLTANDMRLLKVKLLNNSSNNKDIISKHMMKRTKLREEKEKASVANSEDREKRNLIMDRKIKENKRDSSVITQTIPFDTKILTKPTNP